MKICSQFLILTILVLCNIPNAFAGKEEIRAFLSKNEVLAKYGQGAPDGEQLIIVAGMSSWDFKSTILSVPPHPETTIGNLCRLLGFKEVLEAENMLDANGRISEQNMLWIREILSEWVDLTGVNIVYGRSEFEHPDVLGTKILYSISVENISQNRANQLQHRSGWSL